MDSQLQSGGHGIFYGIDEFLTFIIFLPQES